MAICVSTGIIMRTCVYINICKYYTGTVASRHHELFETKGHTLKPYLFTYTRIDFIMFCNITHLDTLICT